MAPATEGASITLALRGAGGLLGHRLLRTILTTQPDMRITSAILGTDEESLRRFSSVYELLKPDLRIFVDAERKTIDRLHSTLPLEPLDQAFGVLAKTDAIIDAALIQGKDRLAGFYASYHNPVIHQSGAYPLHTPVVLPFLPQEAQHYRQSDCLLSGIGPVLFPLRDIIERADLYILVQRQKRLNDYTLRDNLSDISVDPDLEKRIKQSIETLIPAEVNVVTYEVPGHDHYLCTLQLQLSEAIEKEDLLARYSAMPRIKIAPESMPVSTKNVEQLREQYVETGTPLQPIILFPEGRGKRITLRATFYSKAITVLPNIDVARTLVAKMDPLHSMRITDAQYGFKSRSLKTSSSSV